ncbi:MAG TPA: hypothetical protein DC049_13050 [Spirochaetia bacterium]|nr:hypothetical protein [Spirochaetia bacterium]
MSRNLGVFLISNFFYSLKYYRKNIFGYYQPIDLAPVYSFQPGVFFIRINTGNYSLRNTKINIWR